MITRPFGQTGFRSSLLGMGCMRLPRTEQGDIDQQAATALIRAAIDNGVNYVDTAYSYPGSEIALGQALRDGYRDKVKIATKLPAREVKTKADVRAKCLEQMKRLQVDFIDFYLIHRIESTSWEFIKSSGMVEAFQALKDEGLVGGIGFSYHDNLAVFKQVLDHHAWDMCQVQQNYFDVDKEVTEEGIRYAGEKGVALVIMEPLRGGALANPPQDVRDLFANDAQHRTPVEWAFRHLYQYEPISCMLSGMSTREQLTENLTYFQDEQDVVPNCLSDADKALLGQAKAILEQRMLIGCTGCFYCMPCPQGVSIPNHFASYNSGSIFDDWDAAKHEYSFSLRLGGSADQCIECGLCEGQCPQHLPIIKTLKELHARLR